MTSVTPKPALVVTIALEELPRVQLIAGSLEDEHRLRLYLTSEATRQHIRDAILDALDELQEAA